MTEATADVLLAERGEQPATRRIGRGFFLRRIGFYLVAAWSAVTLNFLIPRAMPGSPADSVIATLQQKGGALTADTIASIQKIFGEPKTNIFQQYWNYLVQLAHFNLGLSTSSYPTPVKSMIGQALPWTLLLVGITTIFAFCVGTAIGVICGWRSGSRLDSTLSPLSTFLAAVPYFWVALFALWLLGFQFGWFPLAGGYDPNTAFGSSVGFWLSTLKYGFLPAATIVFSSCGGWLLGMRNMTITTTSEDYVLLARAKGLSPKRVIFRYAARNAILPQFTSFALAIGSILGGALLTETVFTYPGVGHLLYQAVSNRDYPLMQGILLMTTLAVLVANFIADSVYVLLDPRTREQGE
ncbi:MAG TPA: ABC transporter permease [Mycobacteriales bacterium]|jgi:peptide/nickel transport system permease protein|nr:ABC transporter permease [Mycobacteriales bacterium]